MGRCYRRPAVVDGGLVRVLRDHTAWRVAGANSLLDAHSILPLQPIADFRHAGLLPGYRHADARDLPLFLAAQPGQSRFASRLAWLDGDLSSTPQLCIVVHGIFRPR